jgi:molybdate transport system substrate-binding protein
MPGLRAAMEELGPQFEGATGHPVAIQFGLPTQLAAPLASNAFDVVAFNTDAIAGLMAQDKVRPETRADLARMGIGVAARVGAAQPDIGTANAFRHALLNASSISYTKDSAAGAYLAHLMQRLGIAEQMQPKTKLMGGGGENPRAVAAGEVELGLCVISDILPVPGVVLLGPLPPELQHEVTVTAAVGTHAAEPEAAVALIQFLTAPAAAAIYRAKGLAPTAA